MDSRDEKYNLSKVVEKTVCDYFKIKPELILARDTSSVVSNARSIIWHILHYEYGFSIGDLRKLYFRTDRGIKFRVAYVKNSINSYRYYSDMYYTITENIKERSLNTLSK